MSENDKRQHVETFIVTFRGCDDKGKARCRADKLVSIAKAKNGYPMEFLENGPGKGLWLDDDHPIGTVIMSDRTLTTL